MAVCGAIIALNLDSIREWFDPYTHKLVDGFASEALTIKSKYLENTLLYHLGKTAWFLSLLIMIGIIIDM